MTHCSNYLYVFDTLSTFLNESFFAVDKLAFLANTMRRAQFTVFVVDTELIKSIIIC